ncbi:MAG TPA: phosphodiester glycosidase family protein [Chroococcales cyanobacterium]
MKIPHHPRISDLITAAAISSLLLTSCSVTKTPSIKAMQASAIPYALPPVFLPPPKMPESEILPPFKPNFQIPLPPNPKSTAHGKGKPVKFEKRKLKGVPFYQTTIDLADPDTYLSVGLAKDATQANSADFSSGDEAFDSLVKRAHGAVVVNGTFFSKDDQKRVMGNMISGGKILKYSPWENYGTTLGLTRDNKLEMVTAMVEGRPRFAEYWFSITCGPRLLRHGKIELDPVKEKFADSHVLGIGPRAALGFPATCDKLYLVTFMSGLSLKGEAELMKAMGCYEAMNLDGGASKALAHDGTIIVPAQRPLTNVIVVYDAKHPAPQALIGSYNEFGKGAVTELVSQDRPASNVGATGFSQ